MTVGKAFLVKATGRALTAVKNRTLILDTLAIIFNATQHSGTYDGYYLRFEFLIVHPKWITNLTTDQGLLFIFFFFRYWTAICLCCSLWFCLQISSGSCHGKVGGSFKGRIQQKTGHGTFFIFRFYARSQVGRRTTGHAMHYFALRWFSGL